MLGTGLAMLRRENKKIGGLEVREIVSGKVSYLHVLLLYLCQIYL